MRRTEEGWREFGPLTWKVEREDHHGDRSTTTRATLTWTARWSLTAEFTRPWREAVILLIDPKYPHNVGNVVRAMSVFKGDDEAVLRWTGDRVGEAIERRLPREERLAAYRERVDFARLGEHLGGWQEKAGAQKVRPSLDARPLDHYVEWGATPVCVEVSDQAEGLPDHPERPVYVFGPEDGGVPKGVREACHRFVTIPSHGPLNLGSAVSVVLYDRAAKLRAGVV